MRALQAEQHRDTTRECIEPFQRQCLASFRGQCLRGTQARRKQQQTCRRPYRPCPAPSAHPPQASATPVQRHATCSRDASDPRSRLPSCEQCRDTRPTHGTHAPHPSRDPLGQCRHQWLSIRQQATACTRVPCHPSLSVWVHQNLEVTTTRCR